MPYLTVGEILTLRVVALVTRDPALYAELAAALRERRTPSVSLLPGQWIPSKAVVVLTSDRESKLIRHPNVVVVLPDSDRTALWAAVDDSLGQAQSGSELVVGIDPGPRPGYALLSGGAGVGEGNLDSPEDVGVLGSRLHQRFVGRPLRFRVGSGDPTRRNRIVNSLLPLGEPVEIVNERGTTPRGHRRPRDAAAARAIAQTPGRLVKVPVPLAVTPGEIANLQRLSREGSGGVFTIPRSEAHRVLRGELSLSEAIDKGTRRYGSNGGRSRPGVARHERS